LRRQDRHRRQCRRIFLAQFGFVVQRGEVAPRSWTEIWFS
jgi:hypothetical protein